MGAVSGQMGVCVCVCGGGADRGWVEGVSPTAGVKVLDF